MKLLKIFLLTLILTTSCVTAKIDVEKFVKKVINNPEEFDEIMKDTNFVYVDELNKKFKSEFDELKQVLFDYKNGNYSIFDYQCRIYHNIKWIDYDFDIPDTDNIYCLHFKLLFDRRTKTWKIVNFTLGKIWLSNKRK